jgi:hypothetical protein
MPLLTTQSAKGFGFSSLVAAAGPSYESIATTTVGSGGAASVAFSSIPSTYKHLQVRILNKVVSGTPDLLMRFNNDSGLNYNFHILRGNGTSVTAERYIAASISNPVSDYFQASITDIFDYTSTSKTKTSRTLEGRENNTSGEVGMWSHLWFATPAAITSITFIPNTGTNIAQHSSFALYGIKG